MRTESEQREKNGAVSYDSEDMRNYFIRRDAAVCLKEVTRRLTDGGDVLFVPSELFDLRVHLLDRLLSCGGSHVELQFSINSASRSFYINILA